MKSDAGCRTASTLVGAAPASACAWASVGSSTPGRGSSGAASVSIVVPVATSDAAPSAAPLKNSRRPTGLLLELADESATDHLLSLAVETVYQFGARPRSRHRSPTLGPSGESPSGNSTFSGCVITRLHLRR